MRRRALVRLAMVLAGGVLAAGAFLAYRENARHAQEVERLERERAERKARDEAIERVARLTDESRTLMPAVLSGVALGMPEAEVRLHRPSMRPSDVQRGEDRRWLEEPLPGGAQALYGFELGSGRLVLVQILSLLPGSDGVTPHLAAMNERYGGPTGLWLCPDTDGVPTLRFTWRKRTTTVSDVFLFHAGGISVTLYIAPSEIIGQSLKQAACRPTTLEEIRKNPPLAVPQTD